MAGRRRGTGRAVQAQTKAAGRREKLAVALGQAQSPVQLVTAAAAYARAVVASLARRDPRAAEVIAIELVEALTTITDPGRTNRDRK